MLALGVLGASCHPLRVAERASGGTGWFTLAPGEAPWRERLRPVDVDAPGSCDAIGQTAGLPDSSPGAPVVVIVPGLGGEPAAWDESVERLEASAPFGVYLYRWKPWQETDALSRRFAAGLSGLAACLPGQAGEVQVFAHSAGGVIASLAANRLLLGSAREVTVMTIASPLAGTDRVGPRASRAPVQALVLDLGRRLTYPAPVPTARYVHLRTDPASDPVMRPAPSGHRPNRHDVGVPGAPQIDLPRGLGHVEAFDYVVGRVLDGERWRPDERIRAQR